MCYLNYHPVYLCSKLLCHDGRAIAQAFSRRLSTVGFMVDEATQGQVFSEYFGFSCESFIPPINRQSLPYVIQGWYTRPVSGGSNSALGSAAAL
jgi:hypothetical protein